MDFNKITYGMSKLEITNAKLAKENHELKVEGQHLRGRNAELSSKNIDLYTYLRIPDAPPFIQNQEQKSNPFEMQDIVEVILSFLSFKSIQNARFISKTWNRACAGPLSKMGVMTAKLDPLERLPFQMFESIFPTSAPNGSKNYKSLMVEWPEYIRFLTNSDWIHENGKNIEYLRLGPLKPKVGDWDWEGLAPMTWDLEAILLHLCPNLKELVIPIPKIGFDVLVFPGTLLGDPTPRTVHLDRLSIGMDNERVKDTHTTIGLFVVVFGCLASLKSLQLVSQAPVPAFNSYYRLMEIQNEEVPNFDGLQELDLSRYPIGSEGLVSILETGFGSLKTLHLGSIFDAEGEREYGFLKRALDHLKGSLEELVLNSLTLSLDIKLPINDVMPRLPKLRRLKIMCAKYWVIETIDFLLQLPKLVELTLNTTYMLQEQSNIRLDTMFPSAIRLQNEPLLNLRKFNSNCMVHDSQVVELLSKCFPNVEAVQFRFKGTDIMTCLLSLASLPKLRTLDLSFFTPIQRHKLEAAVIAALPNFPELRKLDLGNMACKMSLHKEIFVNGFFKAPRLTSLVLSNSLNTASWNIRPELWNFIRREDGMGSKLEVGTHEVRFKEVTLGQNGVYIA